MAKQFFRAAVRQKLIGESPFDDMKGCTVRGNEKRHFFISRQMADKVLEACPDPQWKLLFALSRFGGLRCPSEHLALRWADVDFKAGRITIRATKTEHHSDGGVRVIPIFPELKPYLETVRRDNPDAFWVITRYRDSNANLRTQLKRIIAKAGLEPWPKLFQNLRSTRETELAETFPMHVVCKWIGNTEAVARKHYLQVTDADFEKAQKPQGALLQALPSDDILGSLASYAVATNPVFLGKNENPLYCETYLVGGTGLEPVTPTV
jgi:integrase